MNDQVTTEQETKAQVDGAIFNEPVEPSDQEIINNSRLISETAIPIPDTLGKLFDKRWKDSLSIIAIYHKDWKRNLQYFNGDNADNQTGPNYPSENITRINVETLVDYTYMRNPGVEISSTDESTAVTASVIERALKTLTTRRGYPGLNIRQKMTKMIIYSHLTNLGCLKVDFQPRIGSIQEAQQLYKALQAKIKEAKDPQELDQHYAGLNRLFTELQSRSEFGVNLKAISPFNLRFPAGVSLTDLSDCPWMMEEEQIDTAYIKSEFTIYDEEEQQHKFRYNPSVVFTEKPTTRSDSLVTTQEAILNEIMPDVEDAERKVIADNTTSCIWVYDRATRMKYLYVRDQWETPLWVWEDQTQFSSFFPYVLLDFSTPLSSILQKGEVTRYIAYQDELNLVEQVRSMIRRIAARVIIYDSQAIDKKEIEKVLSEALTMSDAIRAIGVKLKDNEKSLQDSIEPMVLPAAQLQEFLNPADLRQSVERTSRISEALRGAEFRTNTTNDAIATYNDFAQTRLEGITDKIEEALDRLFWMLAELVVSKYDKDTITTLVPAKMAENFQPMSVADFNEQFHLTIAAGSTEKMNSNNKKKQAMQLIQGLGQFGKSAPQTTLRIIFRMIREVFSPEIITDEDIESLVAETQQMMAMTMGGGATPTPETDPAAAPATQPVA